MGRAGACRYEEGSGNAPRMLKLKTHDDEWMILPVGAPAKLVSTLIWPSCVLPRRSFWSAMIAMVNRIVGEPRVRRAGYDCGEDRPHLGVNGGIFRSAGVAELYELHHLADWARFAQHSLRFRKTAFHSDDNWDSHVSAPVNG